MTRQVEEGAWDYIRKIDEMGGMVSAIEAGYPQAEIGEAAYQYQKQLDSGEKTIVGVNKYVTDNPRITTWKMKPETEERQLKRLREVKEGRNNTRVKELLDMIRNSLPEWRKPYASPCECRQGIRDRARNM